MNGETAVLLANAKRTCHAAIRPNGLRAIAEGIAAPGNDFTIARVQECFLVAAARMEELQAAIRNHSCNYKIGHPIITEPCPICLMEKSFE